MQIQGGIASTTHLDYHGQRMAKSVLDQFAGQIRDKYIPLLINHDFDRQIGVLLTSRVVKLEDGEHALLVVNGIFEDEAEAAAFQSGEVNTTWASYESVLDDVEARGRPSGEVSLAWSCSRRPPPEPDMIVSDRPALR